MCLYAVWYSGCYKVLFICVYKIKFYDYLNQFGRMYLSFQVNGIQSILYHVVLPSEFEENVFSNIKFSQLVKSMEIFGFRIIFP